MQHAWIISVGTELTLGQTVDTNSAWLAARLAAIGIRTLRHVTVPDDDDAIRDALLQAADASDMVLVTGGLGPTDDDLTRPALAEAAGVKLELDEPSLARLRAFFTARNRPMPERNVVQAMVPATGRAILNTCGTAPGLWIRLRGKPCYVMPGVPFEMRTMFEHEIEPALRAAAGGRVLLSRRVNTFGLGESEVGQRIADLMQRGRNPEVGTTVDFGVVAVRINATAPTHSAAEAKLDETEAELRRRLGDVVFGRDNDTLASVVGALLAAAGRTLATAESCTGGLIGALVTDVSGSSAYYRGGAVVYADQAKMDVLGVPADDLGRHGAVSAPVAEAMARGAARVFGADYAVSVTGIAGPTGGTPEKPVGLVYIGLHTQEEVQAREYRFGSDWPRQAIRLRTASTALNLLRLALLQAGRTAPPGAATGFRASGR
jgi:nicotinamide-nucleotide amidase